MQIEITLTTPATVRHCARKRGTRQSTALIGSPFRKLSGFALLDVPSGRDGCHGTASAADSSRVKPLGLPLGWLVRGPDGRRDQRQMREFHAGGDP